MADFPQLEIFSTVARWEVKPPSKANRRAPNHSWTARRYKMVAFCRVVALITVLVVATIPTIFAADKDNSWLVDEVRLTSTGRTPTLLRLSYFLI
jgi:hypothetical protein